MKGQTKAHFIFCVCVCSQKWENYLWRSCHHVWSSHLTFEDFSGTPILYPSSSRAALTQRTFEMTKLSFSKNMELLSTAEHPTKQGIFRMGLHNITLKPPHLLPSLWPCFLPLVAWKPEIINGQLEDVGMWRNASEETQSPIEPSVQSDGLPWNKISWLQQGGTVLYYTLCAAEKLKWLPRDSTISKSNCF